jgi:hypothetical protein
MPPGSIPGLQSIGQLLLGPIQTRTKVHNEAIVQQRVVVRIMAFTTVFVLY